MPPRRPAPRLAAGRLLALLAFPIAAGPGPAAAEAVARRVVSLNPSLTQILLALGAGAALVGVDEYSARETPEVRGLPRVGGLFDPSLEAVVALEPDLVVLVPSAQQRDFRARLEALGIPVLALANVTLPEVLASIRALGERVGRGQAAEARIAAVEGAFAESARESAGRPRERAVLVLQREPLFVVGRGSFLDAMLAAAGLANAAAEFGEPYPRVATEWLIAAAPELILDAAPDPEAPARYWARWPSLPAVARGRVLALEAGAVILPGPWLDRGLRRLIGTVAGEAP
jgi:iron complex transport system substrate-binding protein